MEQRLNIQSQRDHNMSNNTDNSYTDNSSTTTTTTTGDVNNRQINMSRCVQLHKAVLKDDWDAADELLQEDSKLITAKLTDGEEIALHMAAVEGYVHFVGRLLGKMNLSQAQIPNIKGCTALTFAAATGHLDVAEKMLEAYPGLIDIKGPEGVTPLHMAALMGHASVASYFFSHPQQKFLDWPQEEQIALLTACIESGLFGLAKSIVDKKRELAAAVDSNNDTPLGVLARNPSAFTQTQQGDRVGGHFQSFAGKVKKLIKKRDKNKTSSSSSEREYCDAYGLFNCLWDGMMSEQEIETGRRYDKYTTTVVFKAAKFGNYHFLVELIRKDPSFIYAFNHKNQTIIHIAILNRYVEIFNLIYEVGCGTKGLLALSQDPEDNSNMLHLAAKLPSPNKIADFPWVALQMQREVLWYKEVEKIVQPCCVNMVNTEGQTPHQLFLKEHHEMMKEGEKEMKKTAESFMLVTTLITTVIFSATFTVPGGYDDKTGFPILMQNGNRLFLLFLISEAVATLSSLVSMLMFLCILTSRYEENDYLTTLPYWLVTGVMALFVSIVSMMATFCITLLMYGHGMRCVMVLAGLCGCVPIMFLLLKYQQLVGIVRSTYGCRRLFRSNYHNNRLFS